MSGSLSSILITGGLGNLGLWVTEHFLNTDLQVSVLACKSKQLAIEKRVNLLEADISNLESCRQALQGQSFDYVIHLASVNETFLENYPQLALQVNAQGTRNLLQCLDKASLKNFIYLSTFHVYGKAQGIIDELTPVAPRHDYATTHYFAEKYVEQFHQTHQLPYTILRLTNGYGAPKNIDSSKWYLILNDLARMAFEHQQIKLRSNGKASRDFIWLGDVCTTLEQLTLLTEAPQAVFNLSAETSLALLDIAHEVQRAYKDTFGAKIPIEINDHDDSAAIELKVVAQKLKKLIHYAPQNKVYDEAIAIFKLLGETA